MRREFLLIGLASLAACKGDGPQTVGGTAPPGAGGSVHSFVNPTEVKTYSAIGGVQSYSYSTSADVGRQFDRLYAGNASTARNSQISVKYDPRDAIFEVSITDGAAGIDQDLRFQDPLHRTDFGGAEQPQGGVPDIANKNIQYLEAGGIAGPAVSDPTGTFLIGNAGASRNVATFFYQKPGTATNYVTFAGYVRNATNVVEVEDPNRPGFTRLNQNHVLERGVFAFGERTDNNAVPRTGTGSFTGNMLATMVYNPLPEQQGDAPTYFQWIDGTAKIDVDFAASTVNAAFAGKVYAPQLDIYTSGVHSMPADSTFQASGTARIDLVNAGGFVGKIDSASFTTPSALPNDPAVLATPNTTIPVEIAGSSLDGAFYGPAAQEVGGGFRIVGGKPDERIDILGTFTAAKPQQ